MTTNIFRAAAFTSLTILGACASTPPAGPSAQATLEARSGSTAQGTVTLTQTHDGVHIDARISGLTPGQHGFHIHDSGDCSAADGSSAKGHFNPNAKAHGAHDGMEHHAGDMPNLSADASGNAQFSATLAGLTITEGPMSVTGRSVVIHADPDDYKSQPAGNSGKRIACGTIREAKSGY